jgi:hypothetical protein
MHIPYNDVNGYGGNAFVLNRMGGRAINISDMMTILGLNYESRYAIKLTLNMGR